MVDTDIRGRCQANDLHVPLSRISPQGLQSDKRHRGSGIKTMRTSRRHPCPIGAGLAKEALIERRIIPWHVVIATSQAGGVLLFWKTSGNCVREHCIHRHWRWIEAHNLSLAFIIYIFFGFSISHVDRLRPNIWPRYISFLASFSNELRVCGKTAFPLHLEPRTQSVTMIYNRKRGAASF